MAKVEIYTAHFCGYCAHAIRVLKSRGVEYERTDVSFSPDLRARMAERAGGRTSVPQIFINDKHIGGCQELVELDAAGRLAELIAE